MVRLRKRGIALILTLLLISVTSANTFITIIQDIQNGLEPAIITHSLIQKNETWNSKLGKHHYSGITSGDIPILVSFDKDTTLKKQEITQKLEYAPSKEELEISKITVEIGKNMTINKTRVEQDCWQEWTGKMTEENQTWNGDEWIVNKPQQIMETKCNRTVTPYQDWEYHYTQMPDEYTFKAGQTYVINYHGEWQAQLGNKAVDLIPNISNAELNQYAWWNASWNVSFHLAVENLSANRLANWTVWYNFSFPDDLRSRCNANGSDIRFISNDNTTQLQYWIENKSDGDYFYIYWKPETAGNHSEWLYCGNPGAVDESNYSGVAEIAECLDGEFNQTGGWMNNTVYGAGTHHVDEGTYCNFTSDAGDGATNTDHMYGTGWGIVAKTKFHPAGAGSGNDDVTLAFDPAGLGNGTSTAGIFFDTSNKHFRTEDGGGTENSNIDLVADTWHRNYWARTNASSAYYSRDYGLETEEHTANVGVDGTEFGWYMQGSEYYHVDYLIMFNITSDGLEPNITITPPDTTPPTWQDNETNGTENGTWIQHSVLWSDNINTSGYVFGFCNGTYYPSTNACVNGSADTTTNETLYEDTFTNADNWTTSGNCAGYWTIGSSTPSVSTGPQDGDSDDDTTNFVYMETSSGYCDGTPSDGIIMYDQDVDWDAQSGEWITVKTNFYGDDADLGELSVWENSTGSWVYMATIAEDDDGNSGREWTTQAVDASSLTGTGNIRFYLNECASYLGDAAMDNLIITYESTSVVNTTNWQNDSWAAFGATNYSNTTKYVNITNNTRIGWVYWSNDSWNNWNMTDYFWYDTYGEGEPPVGDACDYTSGTWVIDEDCVVDSATDLGGDDAYLHCPSYVELAANVTGTGMLYVETGCTLFIPTNYEWE